MLNISVPLVFTLRDTLSLDAICPNWLGSVRVIVSSKNHKSMVKEWTLALRPFSSLAHRTNLKFFSLADNVFQKYCGNGQVDENAGYVVCSGNERSGGHRRIGSQALEDDGYQGTHE